MSPEKITVSVDNATGLLALLHNSSLHVHTSAGTPKWVVSTQPTDVRGTQPLVISTTCLPPAAEKLDVQI